MGQIAGNDAQLRIAVPLANIGNDALQGLLRVKGGCGGVFWGGINEMTVAYVNYFHDGPVCPLRCVAEEYIVAFHLLGQWNIR